MFVFDALSWRQKEKNKDHETIPFTLLHGTIWVIFVILTYALCFSSSYGEYDSWR